MRFTESAPACNIDLPAGPGPTASQRYAGGGRAGSRQTRALAHADLHGTARALLKQGFRLALVSARSPGPAGSHRVVYVFTAARPDRRIQLVVDTDPESLTVPSLALLSFPAGTFERELYDTHGIVASSSSPRAESATTRGPCMRHEAGPLSPTLRLEAQAGGQRPWALLHQVEHVVPGCVVGHALTFCLAVEDAYGWIAPAPVQVLRAIVLELERIHNHLDAVATMCARAEVTTLSMKARDLWEQALRLNREMCGHELLHGAITPGGVSVARLPTDRHLRALSSAAAQLAEATVADPLLREAYRGRWTLTNRHAAMTGVLGFIARASGVDIDARRDHCFHPCMTQIASVTSDNGDAHARLQVRAAEIEASFGLVRQLVADAHPLTIVANPPRVPSDGFLCGIGLVEGTHGTIAHRIEFTAGGKVAHLRLVDPAIFARPVLALSRRGPHDEHGSTVDPGFGLSRAHI